MNPITTLSLTVAALMLTAAPLHAQYTGPSKNPARTVAHVLNNAKDDEMVILTGRITGKIADETYTFADATGEMQVEIDDDLFTAPISNTTMVEIHGKVDKHMIKPTEVDVKTLIIKP